MAERLRRCIQAITRLSDRGTEDMQAAVRPLVRDLVGRDDWLDRAFAEPDAARFRQYLLHCDPLERFSVVAMVLAPGQRTPVHNHTVWGVVGVLRGRELSRPFGRAGRDAPIRRAAGPDDILVPGQVLAVSADADDWHEVVNPSATDPSVSVHVYGANIGAVRREVVTEDGGTVRSFISGYANGVVPNLWDRSGDRHPR